MINRLQAVWVSVSMRARVYWQKFRSWKKWQQGAATAGLLVLVITGASYLHTETPVSGGNLIPSVQLASVASLSSLGGGVSVIGTVRSQSEADILAKTGGVVQSLHASLGATVPAGYVIAELENASERAALLQAEGAYEAAVAARGAASLSETQTSATNVYATAYTTLDTVLENYIDLFFGIPTSYGPALLVSAGGEADATELSRRRVALGLTMNTWQDQLVSAETKEPEPLLDEAYDTAKVFSAFLTDLAQVANAKGSNASDAQLSGLATARTSVNTLLSTISTARTTYRSGSVDATVGADASVKVALGALRAAEANVEKTIIRAPIGGTINFLPLRRGAYVTALSHVATVAQNGALEVVAYVSGDERNLLAVGNRVQIEGGAEGTITSVSPALNPVTKQIEIRIAVIGTPALENGESVRIALPNVRPLDTQVSGPLTLPLAAVKLESDRRVVFTVSEDRRLVAHEVTIGEVRGNRLEIVSGLTPDMQIVTDARGLAEGEAVAVVEAS